MRTYHSYILTKSLFSHLAGVNKTTSRSAKIKQMADEIEDGVEQVRLLLGKHDLNGAAAKLDWIDDLFIDALDLAESAGTGTLKETRAHIRDAKRHLDEIRSLIRKGEAKRARELLEQHDDLIEDSLGPLRRVATYIKD